MQNRVASAGTPMSRRRNSRRKSARTPASAAKGIAPINPSGDHKAVSGSSANAAPSGALPLRQSR